MCPTPPHLQETWEQGFPAGQNARPSERVPDWRTGGAPHLEIKIPPWVTPYFKKFEMFWGLLLP